MPNGPIDRRRFVQTVGGLTAAASRLSAQGDWSFRSRWEGTRIWIGPEYWANPLQNWRTENGEVVAKAAAGRTLHLLTHQIVDGGGFRTEAELRLSRKGSEPTWAGFVFGVRGTLPGYQSALVHQQPGVEAGVRSDGRLFVEDQESAGTVDVEKPVRLRLQASDDGELKLSAGGVAVETKVDPSRLPGNLALAAQADGQPNAETTDAEWAFASWRAGGAGLAHRPEQTFGPILWTQYTLSRGTVKLAALFPPLGPQDERTARLELRGASGWEGASEAEIEPLSRTAIFRLEDWDDSRAVDYRVVYRWAGEEHSWGGRIRRDPKDASELKVGVFSCDHGECFPQRRMVRNVEIQDPDILFFAGDQIYESHGGFGVARGKPSEEAMLDYLRKYWQHGWTWRGLLCDRPSIVIPDDHDVFQGNIWGQGGRPLPPWEGQPRASFESGGYLMPVDWVNAVQRTQAGHLPDPADPQPLESGIEVYFTELRYGGASFAVIEDRKFKTGPYDVLTEEQRTRARAGDYGVADVAEAEMLGARQEEFLRRWTRESADADFRLVCSQTIFCKATTHSGRDLNRAIVDLDCGGWPQTARNRALKILAGAPDAIMLHGDQHTGALVRQGVDEWEDSVIGYMVPGTSNGFPRAWWPETPGENRAADAPEWTGRYRDGLGNRMTMLGAANPEPGSNTRERQAGLDPEQVAHIKGSGHGIVRLDRAGRQATFEIWRHAWNATDPRPQDQFDGFPITLDLPEKS